MSVIKNFCIINVTLFLFSYKKPKCVCTINQVLQLITVFVGARVQWTTQPCFFYSTVFGIFFTVSPSQQLKQKITIQKERVEFATLHEGIQPSRNCVIIGVFVCFFVFWVLDDLPVKGTWQTHIRGYKRQAGNSQSLSSSRWFNVYDYELHKSINFDSVTSRQHLF